MNVNARIGPLWRVVYMQKILMNAEYWCKSEWCDKPNIDKYTTTTTTTTTPASAFGLDLRPFGSQGAALRALHPGSTLYQHL